MTDLSDSSFIFSNDIDYNQKFYWYNGHNAKISNNDSSYLIMTIEPLNGKFFTNNINTNLNIINITDCTDCTDCTVSNTEHYHINSLIISIDKPTYKSINFFDEHKKYVNSNTIDHTEFTRLLRMDNNIKVSYISLSKKEYGPEIYVYKNDFVKQLLIKGTGCDYYNNEISLFYNSDLNLIDMYDNSSNTARLIKPNISNNNYNEYRRPVNVSIYDLKVANSNWSDNGTYILSYTITKQQTIDAEYISGSFEISAYSGSGGEINFTWNKPSDRYVAYLRFTNLEYRPG